MSGEWRGVQTRDTTQIAEMEEITVSNVVNKTNSWKLNLTTNKITEAPASAPAPAREIVSDSGSGSV